MKQCNACHQFKELDRFIKYRQRGKEYIRHTCRDCTNSAAKKSAGYIKTQTGYDNKRAKKERQKHNLKVKYGECVAEMLLHDYGSDVDIMRELNGY